MGGVRCQAAAVLTPFFQRQDRTSNYTLLFLVPSARLGLRRVKRVSRYASVTRNSPSERER